MTKPACHICHTPSAFLMKKDGFDEYLCPSCGLSFIFPQPAQEWLKDNVYSYESGYQGNKKADLKATIQEKRTTQILDFLVKEKPEGTLLDVGCSNGQFMYWATERGFSCKGIEINKRTADMATENGFVVHQGFVEHAPYAKQSFDVVYMGDVIEHVNDPRAFVETCIGFLKPDGVLAISTPNVDCWWSHTTLSFFRMLGIPWSSATPPHHLFQFGVGNLDTLVGEKRFKNVGAIFARPPSLMYEFGSLHLWKHYKQQKTLGRFLFMLLSFGLYALVYGLNIVFRPFLRKDFRMICFYKRPINSGNSSVQ